VQGWHALWHRLSREKGTNDFPLSARKSGWPLLRNPLSRKTAIALTAGQFNHGFTNTFAAAGAPRACEHYAIPGSRNVLLTGVYANLNPSTPLRIDFRNDKRAPLLFIAGGADHVIPASVNGTTPTSTRARKRSQH